jgi:hypothetical protein
MVDRVSRGALSSCHEAAELDQFAFVVPNENLIEILRG